MNFPLCKSTFRRLTKEGRKISDFRENNLLKATLCPTELGICYFVYLLWESPCWERRLAIGAEAVYIACSDTSVIVINFRKSKTHAITDTYCTFFFSPPSYKFSSATHFSYFWLETGSSELIFALSMASKQKRPLTTCTAWKRKQIFVWITVVLFSKVRKCKNMYRTKFCYFTVLYIQRRELYYRLQQKGKKIRVDLIWWCVRENMNNQGDERKGDRGDWADLTAIYVLVVQWCTVRWCWIKICLQRLPASGNQALRVQLYRFYDHWKKRKSSIEYLEASLPFHPECRTLFGHAICAYWQAVGQVFFSLYHRSLAPHELLCGGHVKTSCFCRGSEIRLIPML